MSIRPARSHWASGLIERVKLVDSIPADDRLVARIRVAVAKGQLSSELGKELLALHREEVASGSAPRKGAVR